jgi:hypothetical protein
MFTAKIDDCGGGAGAGEYTMLTTLNGKEQMNTGSAGE